MFETNTNFDAVHATNNNTFGTPSVAWLKWLESLSTTKQDIGASALIEEETL